MYLPSRIISSTLFALSLSLYSSSCYTFVTGLNADCTLSVPQNPLSSVGLSTPYGLGGLNPATAGPCNQINPTQQSFIQGAIIDFISGKINIYNPLVVDIGTKPAAPIIVPTLSQSSVVGLWFGSNAGTLTLIDLNGSLQQGNCINGLNINGNIDIFGQFSYCNAPAWFAVANQMIASGLLVVPPLGTYNIPASTNRSAIHNQPCPSIRSFTIVDQDQSDNMVTAYLLTATGTTAQMTAANTKSLVGATAIANGSDNRLVAVALAASLGCKPFTAPDLADPGSYLPAVPLNELQAAAYQQGPIAVIPDNDPMVLSGGLPSLTKVNLYRAGVNQVIASSLSTASGIEYCVNFLIQASQWINQTLPLTINSGSPDTGAASNLFTFLANRFVASVGPNNLNCLALLDITIPPYMLTTNANGQVTSATLDPGFVAQMAAAAAIFPTPASPSSSSPTVNTFDSTSFGIGFGSALAVVAFCIIVVIGILMLKNRRERKSTHSANVTSMTVSELNAGIATGVGSPTQRGRADADAGQKVPAGAYRAPPVPYRGPSVAVMVANLGVAENC